MKIAIINKQTDERGEFDVPHSNIVDLKKFARNHYANIPTAWLDIYKVLNDGKHHWVTGFIINPPKTGG